MKTKKDRKNRMSQKYLDESAVYGDNTGMKIMKVKKTNNSVQQ